MFDDKSRYRNLPEKTFTDATGRQIRHVGRRLLPDGGAMQQMTEVVVTEGERLDLIAHRTLGESTASWRLADANDALHPDELLDVGGKVRVPTPQS